MMHRNGKFIRNSFLPADSTVSIKLEEPRRMWVADLRLVLYCVLFL